jgi:hypothetical protein
MQRPKTSSAPSTFSPAPRFGIEGQPFGDDVRRPGGPRREEQGMTRTLREKDPDRIGSDEPPRSKNASNERTEKMAVAQMSRPRPRRGSARSALTTDASARVPGHAIRIAAVDRNPALIIPAWAESSPARTRAARPCPLAAAISSNAARRSPWRLVERCRPCLSRHPTTRFR